MENDEEVEKETISLENVVQQVDDEMHMFESAHALLGPADDKFCTYFQGYMERQVLYSCLTCKNNKPAGVCLACSLQCHDGHDLIELYTKRNFQCDCGNSLYPNDFKCKLDSKKSMVNDLNEYNHNFEGTFCTCSRPYPDYDDSIEDIMIQCIICEDWLHGRHATSLDLNDVEFEEMICEACLKKHSFLLQYIHSCQAIYDKKNNQELNESSKYPNPLNRSDKNLTNNNSIIGSKFNNIETGGCQNMLYNKNIDNFKEVVCDGVDSLEASIPKGNSSQMIRESPIITDSIQVNKFESSASDIVVSTENNSSYSCDKFGLDTNKDSRVNITSSSSDCIVSTNNSSSRDPSQSNINGTEDLLTSSAQTIFLKSLPTSSNSDNIEVTLSDSSNISSSKASNLKCNDRNICFLSSVANIDIDYQSGAVFLSSEWREKLCRCHQCLELYEREKIKFLLSPTDSLKHYESKNKSIDSLANHHLDQMNHVQKIELVQGYMDLKNGLVDYLKKFENGKAVREEDILEFFEGLNSNKKKKTE